MRYLDLNSLPIVYKHYPFSFKKFNKGELHETRIPEFDTLILVFEGTLSFIEDGNRIDISAGQYYIQPAGTKQSGIPLNSPPMYFYLHFNGKHLNEKTDFAMPEFGSFNIDEMKTNCGQLFLRNSNTLMEKNLLFYNILEKLKFENQSENYSLATSIEYYISGNITSVSSLDDLCEKFNYSKDYIIRLFKEKYNVTPHRYITSKKIGYASDLLKETNISVQQISKQCGYSDATVFFRAFKSVTGLSPTEFRAKAQK